MEKTKSLGRAFCVDVAPRKDEATVEWVWRKDYVGLTGWLQLKSEGESESPFLYFFSHDWWLKTGHGDVIIEGDAVTMVTKTSTYKFQLRKGE